MKMFMVVGAVLVGGVLFLGLESVQARPNYHKAFVAEYPAVADAAKTAKCAVCHDGAPQDKKWNNYGAAMGKALGKKKADEAEAKSAIEKAAAEKSAVDGKTFGDLIKDGKLPASK